MQKPLDPVHNSGLLREALSEAASYRAVLELILASSDAQSSLPASDSRLLWDTCSFLVRQALRQPSVAPFAHALPDVSPTNDPPCLAWNNPEQCA